MGLMTMPLCWRINLTKMRLQIVPYKSFLLILPTILSQQNEFNLFSLFCLMFINFFIDDDSRFIFCSFVD